MKASPLVKSLTGIILLLGVFGPLTAYSAESGYPTKAVEYVVPFPAGGGTDVAARVIAKAFSRELGVPFNVTNKPGGNQIPGVLSVMSSPSNGYTLLADGSGSSSLQTLIKDLPYKMEARAFVARIMISPHAYIVNGKSPWNSLKDVIAAAKNDPGSFTWTWHGGNTTSDFSLLQFFDVAGIDIAKTKRVPFQGTGPSSQAVAGGHVLFGSGGASAMFSLSRSGNIKILAVTGDKRLPTLPEVISCQEAGLASLDVMFWVGVSGPQGLPKPVVDKLAGVAKKISEDAQVVKELEAIGAYPSYMNPEEVSKQVSKEAVIFKTLASKAGIP
ncbi:MAG: tripartite tricarboxylate transporter substrate binding protein [Thermodesulfobacteriota bacterium]